MKALHINIDGQVIDLSSDVSTKTAAIPFGTVDGTSTATAFTATVDGITAYADGVCCILKNGVVTSQSGFTLNINNLGAKNVYTNLASQTLESTIFNIDYTMMFIYDSTRVSGGAWICYRGYDSDPQIITASEINAVCTW